MAASSLQITDVGVIDSALGATHGAPKRITKGMYPREGVARYATQPRGALTRSALALLRHLFGVIVIMYKVGTSSRSP
jgi:hypothetical protein